MGASAGFGANRVGFLHTAQVHVSTFDELAQERNLHATHHVQEDWLTRAVSQGLTSKLREQVIETLRELAQQCDVVICTCSTLGALATDFPDSSVFRVDEPMMRQAAASSGATLLVYCLPSTRDSSAELLRAAYAAADKPASYKLLECREVWPLFERGDAEEFGRVIARQIVAELKQPDNSQVTAIVLAQASMAAALKPLAHVPVPVFASPASAMDHAMELLKS